MESGVATRPIGDLEAYRKKLHDFVNRAGLFMQPMIEAAKQGPTRRLVYSEGENDEILMAMQAVVDEGVAKPTIIARPEVVKQKMERLGLRFNLEEDVHVFDPNDCDQHNKYWQHYHERVGRKGITVEAAKAEMRNNSTALAAVMVSLGEAHGMICGKVGRFDGHFQRIYEVLGTKSAQKHVSSVCALLLPTGPLFIADAFLNEDPNAEELVSITEASIEFVRQFGVNPKVALLSHSNFGSSRGGPAKKMRHASALLRERLPDVEIEGEMHAYTAMNEELRQLIFPGANLTGRANLLIMPNLDAANIALGLIRSLTDALLVGPFLTGLNKPAHIVIPSVTARGIFNMSAMTAADVQRYCENNVCLP
jgi:malate dehydrogenase (oxaloacetate-decarboxylating)(NADP+)